MASITCGNCGQKHASVESVKACYARITAPITSERAIIGVPRQTAMGTKVPESRYAVRNLAGASNDITFFSVKNGKGKWEGMQFVSRLVGGGVGSFVEYPVKGAPKAIVLSKIAADPQSAAKAFADEFSVCARCGRTLTDDDSRARGLGADCAEKF